MFPFKLHKKPHGTLLLNEAALFKNWVTTKSHKMQNNTYLMKHFMLGCESAIFFLFIYFIFLRGGGWGWGI